MKRALRKLGYALGALCLSVTLFAAIEHWRGRSALERRLKELAQQHEQLSVQAWLPQRPAPDQNSAVELTNLNLSVAVLTNWDNLPPSSRNRTPGKKVVLWRVPAWSFDGSKTNDWRSVARELDQAQELLRAVHRVARRPAYDTGFDYHQSFVDSLAGTVWKVKSAAVLLRMAMLCELSRGNLDAAHEDLLDLIGLAARQRTEPLAICQGVRQACAALAFQATWEALQAPGWTDAQLAAWQNAWQAGDFFAGDMAGALEMERAMDVDFFQRVRRSRRELASAIAQREAWGHRQSPFVTHGFFLNWINVPLWRIAWADQDTLRELNRWQGFMDKLRLARTNSWAALRAGNGRDRQPQIPWWTSTVDERLQASWPDRFRFLFSSGWFDKEEKLIFRMLHTQVQQQMAITALALRRYQDRKHQPASELGALVPEYLPALPRDSMDGGVLRYRLRPDATWVLYSVGDNGKDDGGDPTPNTTTLYDTRDEVWPTAATPEEAAAAMQPRAR